MPKKKRNKTPSFTLTLPLRIEPWQKDKLDTDFRVDCHIYNCMVASTQKRYNQMVKLKEYRYYVSLAKRFRKAGDEARLKKAYEKLAEIRERFGITKEAFEKEIKAYQKHFFKNLNSAVAQKLALSLWNAYEKVLFSTGKTVHFKKFDSFLSIEGKNNETGIVHENRIFYYGYGLKIKMPVKANPRNLYEQQAFNSRVKYCRIVRKWVKDGWKYYAQLILEGVAPAKINFKTGEFKHKVASGKRTGVDIGTQTIAAVSHSKVMLCEIADKVQKCENELRRINRAMDRSRRATNQDMFDEKGRIIKTNKLPKELLNQFGKRIWVKSKHYKKLEAKRRDMYRKQAEIRKMQHCILANQVLAMGNIVYVENMNFKALQKRAKTTTTNAKTGKINSKKRFGKSLANKAPSMFLSILERKVVQSGGKSIKINTTEAKASQYNHLNHKYNKKKLSQRWNKMPDGRKIQRDLYSAFLLSNINDDLSTFNDELCKQEYENFVVLHDEEIKRLQGVDTPCSTGIKKVA